MKPTNEERREVADRLWAIVDKSPRDADLFELLSDAIGVDAYGLGVDGLLTELADLIEPEERTCRNTSEAVVKGPFTCSACGEYSKTWYHMGFGDMYADVPNFCPNCGSRVVKEGAE